MRVLIFSIAFVAVLPVGHASAKLETTLRQPLLAARHRLSQAARAHAQSLKLALEGAQSAKQAADPSLAATERFVSGLEARVEAHEFDLSYLANAFARGDVAWRAQEYATLIKEQEALLGDNSRGWAGDMYGPARTGINAFLAKQLELPEGMRPSELGWREIELEGLKATEGLEVTPRASAGEPKEGDIATVAKLLADLSHYFLGPVAERTAADHAALAAGLFDMNAMERISQYLVFYAAHSKDRTRTAGLESRRDRSIKMIERYLANRTF
jgi:hypothetical protein